MIDFFCEMMRRRFPKREKIILGHRGDVKLVGRFWGKGGFDRKGNPITEWTPFDNGVTTVGENYLLNTGFRGTAQLSSWYCGLIAEAVSVVLSAADTSASHAGWTERTEYSSGTRPAWSPGAASAGALTLSSAISYTMSSTVDVRGAFLASSSTKSSAVDTLYSTAIESAARTIASGATYQLYYSVTATPG